MIVAFGTINVDMVTGVSHFPVPGETVKGQDYRLFAGGKGANQALAAARCGASVIMCGAVGNDGFADLALSNLIAAGVDVSLVSRAASPTGMFMIAIDPTGENLMIGANAANDSARAAVMVSELRPGRMLMTQNSLGPSEVEAAIAMAHAAGCRIVYNAAPAEPVADATIAAADVVIVNEHEARGYGEMLGLPGAPEEFAAALARRFGKAAIVTLGPAGIVAAWGDRRVRAAPPRIIAVDTTGAGDAFCGALAASLDRGDGLDVAILEALAAGSLACTALGAQTSFRGRADISRLAAGLTLTDI